MPKIVTPLSDSKIKEAKFKDKNYTLSDGKGLHLLIKSSGSKLWEYIYISPTTRKRRKTSFGTYPNITLKNARLKRNEFKTMINDGIDPLEQKEKEKMLIQQEQINKTRTIESIVDKYFEVKQHNKNLKDITITKAYGRIKNHFYAHLPQKEKTSIFDINFNIVVPILQKLEEAKKLETLDRVKKLLIDIFKYAYTENIINDTDLFAKLEIKTFKKVSKANVRNSPTLTNPKEIKQLLRDIEVYPGEVLTKYALLMSLYTAQRQGSIITAKWSDIDFDKKLWIIPSERMKMKREHILPLSDKMIEILTDLKQYHNQEYIFPNTQNKGSHMSNATVNLALRRMGYEKDQIVAHGFRAMFSTICNEHISEHNISYEFIEKALAHQEKNEVRNAYNHAKNINEMRVLMNWWSDYLNKLKDEVK